MGSRNQPNLQTRQRCDFGPCRENKTEENVARAVVSAQEEGIHRAFLHLLEDQRCSDRCISGRFSGSSEDPLNQPPITLLSTPVLHRIEKSKGSQRETPSHGHRTV
ncbi:hypothetical protein UY3_08070 [Chelonia mydas]|uniref:Uncharacterized protein n=1 Tax=Chelonia mydas TaxID=8469 RepID=M7BRQ8_CHEMY|nr:hypothetical protein UY3_08070 [Chelonia mydas]